MTPRTVTHQAPLSMGFPRQEYWSGLPFPLPGNLPVPGIKPTSPAWQAYSLTLSHQRKACLWANFAIFQEGNESEGKRQSF